MNKLCGVSALISFHRNEAVICESKAESDMFVSIIYMVFYALHILLNFVPPHLSNFQKKATKRWCSGPQGSSGRKESSGAGFGLRCGTKCAAKNETINCTYSTDADGLVNAVD